MLAFPRKSHNIPKTGHTYSYIRILPSSLDKSTILFLHGFPAIASSWRHQIDYFVQLGYGIIAPDVLGFGASSKPLDAAEYRSHVMVEDLLALLDQEKIESCHGVGHDAGTYLLSRLYNYHPAGFLSVTFIATPYVPPAGHIDIGALNEMMKKAVGFEKFGYAQFLASDSSPSLIEKHIASFQSLAYHSDVNIKADNFYPPGRLEAWLTADRNDNQILLSPEESKAWFEAFNKGGFRGPTNGYRVMAENLSEEEEKADMAAGRLTTKITVPVLTIDSTPDKSTVPGMLQAATQPHASSDVTAKTVQSQGHYPHIVSKDEVNKILHDFLTGIHP